VTLAFTVLFTAFVCMDILRRPVTSIPALLLSVSHVIVGYAMLQLVFLVRHPGLWAQMRDLSQLVEAIEADPGGKLWVVNARRTIMVLCTVSITYNVFFFTHVTADALFAEEPVVPLWPFVPHAGAWGTHLGRLFYGACLVAWLPPSVVFTVTLILGTAVPAGLHHALARRLDDSVSPSSVRAVVAKHMRLRQLAQGLTDFYSTRLAHIQVASFFYAVFGLINVLEDDVSFTTVNFLFPLVNDFLQFSYLSQELSDSSASLAEAAYYASIGGSVGLHEAHALGLVMRIASSSPALHCRGLGRLSLAAAGNALGKTWKMVSVLRDKL
ncbi:Odorant receptor 25, partial [Frankliniella occidentalis]